MKINEVTEKVGVKTSHYIITGIALTVGMAWNSAVKALIDKVYPLEKDGSNIYASFMYAIIITIVLVIIIEVLPDTSGELPESMQNKIKAEEFMRKNKKYKIV